MKSLTKRVSVLTTVLVIAIAMIVGSCLILGDYALADTDSDHAYKYYYDQISNDKIAERFYKAFETLANNGEFKKGKLQYNLVANNVVTKDEVQAYVGGRDDNKFVKAFGMGRDAFYMDHPDLFYVDLFNTSITAGMQDGEYVAYLDSSRALTMYRGSINTEALVDEAITKYENKVNEIVDGAKNLSSVKEKVEYVNDYISKNNTYGYGTVVEGDRNVDTPKADYIFTSYGALVNCESVCEGYAKSFKAVMDRLGIPCVCVAGYGSEKEDGSRVPHMWNHVQVDGMWYAVDVTYNATSVGNPWILVGEQTLFNTHVEDNTVSSSGFELKSPALKPYDYGVDSDENGMTVIGTYVTDAELGKYLNLSISYEGKGAEKLEAEGKYLAYSYAYYKDDNKMIWTDWMNFLAMNKAMEEEYFPITDTEVKMEVSTQIQYVKFALLKIAPNGDAYMGDVIVSYNMKELTDDDFWIKPTAPYHNEGFNSYVTAPGVTSAYPSNSAPLPVDQTYDIKIVYSEKLELDAGFTTDTISLDYFSSRGNDTIKENSKITNFKWDSDKTLTFTFTPSKMYIHDYARYYFTPVGLIGAQSKKAPYSFSYSFAGESIICNKMLPGGQLYMKVYGAPNLLDTSDVSVTDFKDENGKYFAESQRSQLILVASKTDTVREKEMDQTLKSDTGIKAEDIVSSSSYEINLNICGVVPKIPNGTYMQVAFGFPEGYDADDEGTTFKIYHYKTDNKGNITGVEEIPVIINQYGIIAKVTSFSPFTVVQVKNTSSVVTQSNTANVYAYVNGEIGGTITAEGKSGISEVSDKITYDITPDEGYAIACVRLNGKVVDANNYSDGKLTLAKKDIQSSNMLEVSFMAKEFATNYAEKGMTISYGEAFAFGDDANPPKSNLAAILIGCSVAVVVVVAVALAVFFIMKKKKDDNRVVATAGAKSKAKTATTKSAPTKVNKPTATKSTTATASKPTASVTKSASTASKTTAAKPTASKAVTAKKEVAATKTTSAAKPAATASKTTASKSNATAKPTASKTASTAKKPTTASKSTSTTSKKK
ncbi:MAG: hypothetical protein K2M75_06400 [Clostridia bacterium]|nr:hypothetical protein [Clostridia bacterium]